MKPDLTDPKVKAAIEGAAIADLLNAASWRVSQALRATQGDTIVGTPQEDLHLAIAYLEEALKRVGP